MNMCHCIALSVALSVFFLGNFCTAIDRNENGLLDKLHKHGSVRGSLEPVPANNEPSVRSHSRRPRRLTDIDEYKEEDVDIKELSKTVRGMQSEYKKLEYILSQQRTSAEKMDQNLDAVQHVINEIQGNVMLVTSTLGRLMTQVQAIENDTLKLDSAVFNINVLVQQLLNTEKERTVQISKLESVAKQIISAISQESVNKTIQELIPSAVRSSTEDLRRQVSELKSELKENKATQVIKSAPIIAMDLQEALLQQISELKQKCVSKEELEQRLQNVTTREVRDNTNTVSKCSVNVRHEPEGGRTHLRLVMDPPSTQSANCKQSGA